MTRYSLVLLVAIGCKSAPASQPATVEGTTTAADEPRPLPPAQDPARRYGYPNDAQCAAAVSNMIALIKTNNDAADKMSAYGADKVREEADAECRKRWFLAHVDCMALATKFEDLDVCMSESFDVPAGLDVSTAPNRPNTDVCRAAVERLATLSPGTYSDETRTTLVTECLQRWRLTAATCVTGAATTASAEACLQ